jgi:Helix-turn-helix domain
MHDADTTWVHLFKSMVFGGDAAKMGPDAIAVYLVIKCHVHWGSGESFPKRSAIAQQAGISERQVSYAFKRLEKFGYLSKQKVGRENVYTVREKVEMFDPVTRRPTAVATWDYLPATVKTAMAELRHFKLTGESDQAMVIHIEHLTINQPVVLNVSDPRTGLDALREALGYAQATAAQPQQDAALRKK